MNKVENKNLKILYLLLAVLFGVIGFMRCINWNKFDSLLFVYVFNFFPALVFIVAYKIKKITESTVALTCFFTIICWVIIAITVAISSATSEVTDIGKYERVLKGCWGLNNELVMHFPNSIPPDAKDVRFSFRPAYLQGGAHIQIGYSLASSVIASLYSDFSSKSTKSFLGGDNNSHMQEGWLTTYFYTSETGGVVFPDDYEIIVLDVIKKDGKSHGVAVSKKKNRIIYWAEESR